MGCLIAFDLDTKELEKYFNEHENVAYNNCYKYIRDVFKVYGFRPRQGTVYIGEAGVQQAHGVMALEELARRYSWFCSPYIYDIQFIEYIYDYKAEFIIERVAQQRKAVEQRIKLLRQNLLEAGLTPEQIEKIINREREQLMIENNPPPLLPSK